MVLDNPRNYQRQDTSDDRLFYEMPRLVIHVDENASAELAKYLRACLPGDGIILDIMSSYRSHLPDDVNFPSVIGLGMNAVELRENGQLSGGLIHDLNKRPTIPITDGAFDAAILCFSMQYLTDPVAVLSDIGRVLKPGAACHIAYSNRLFPTKAVYIWQSVSDVQKAELIARYFDESGLFEAPEAERLVAPGAGFDPLYVVRAARNA